MLNRRPTNPVNYAYTRLLTQENIIYFIIHYSDIPVCILL